ncbi:ESX secretion-associated protein EspG [Saccharopolyspora erythraea]|uniref:ESX secretion-associated protein EspG n=1 Tax=Saccharopolyspora erythraea TaxID=1836 RepID=UPI001BAB5097|nr:ESX secretion-associated protein EspG [Saccharopolyspora erythraea]QUH01631.1 ESX secretion-associated protein EspG [Saccharopolyspora erythraea]
MKIELSKQAFYEAWKHFKLGTKPIVLNVLSEGVLQSERRAAEQRAWDELRGLGFGDRDREDDIYGLFLPLHRYERAFDVTFRRLVDGEQRKLSGMVAAVRANATLAVQTEDRVQLQALPTDSMVRALLSVLPDLKAGPGRAVSLRSAQMEKAAKEAGKSDLAMAEGLARNGVRRDDARALIDMAGGKRTSFAQFGAAVMDGHGKRARGAVVTNCFANAKGWYFMEESRRSGEPWTTIAPIDKAKLAPRVQDLLKSIPRD